MTAALLFGAGAARLSRQGRQSFWIDAPSHTTVSIAAWWTDVTHEKVLSQQKSTKVVRSLQISTRVNTSQQKSAQVDRSQHSSTPVGTTLMKWRRIIGERHRYWNIKGCGDAARIFTGKFLFFRRKGRGGFCSKCGTNVPPQVLPRFSSFRR